MKTSDYVPHIGICFCVVVEYCWLPKQLVDLRRLAVLSESFGNLDLNRKTKVIIGQCWFLQNFTETSKFCRNWQISCLGSKFRSPWKTCVPNNWPVACRCICSDAFFVDLFVFISCRRRSGVCWQSVHSVRIWWSLSTTKLCQALTDDVQSLLLVLRQQQRQY